MAYPYLYSIDLGESTVQDAFADKGHETIVVWRDIYVQ